MSEDNKCNKINEKIYKALRRKYDTYTIKLIDHTPQRGIYSKETEWRNSHF